MNDQGSAAAVAADEALINRVTDPSVTIAADDEPVARLLVEWNRTVGQGDPYDYFVMQAPVSRDRDSLIDDCLLLLVTILLALDSVFFVVLSLLI